MSQTCSRCGQEVRYGQRGLVTGWLHREDVDHQPIFGHIWTPEDQEHVEREYREVVRTMEDGTTYTTAEFDILKDKDAERRKRRLAEFRSEGPDHAPPIPEPEVRAHPLEVADLRPGSGMRQIATLVTKTDGWELRRVTGSRGPYVGSAGGVLSISDTIVIGARGPEVDEGVKVAVASWRDDSFDFAYAGLIRGDRCFTHKVNATELKTWIKGEKP